MKVYNFDIHTGFYLGESEADTNPVTSEPMLDADQTKLPPLQHVDGMITLFANGEWIQKKDYRGQKWVRIADKALIEITEFNQSLEGLTYSRPTTQLDKYNLGTDCWEQDVNEYVLHAKAKVIAECNDMRVDACGGKSNPAISANNTKAVVAKKIVDGEASQNEILQAQLEADIRGRGESAKDLADKQLKKSEIQAVAMAGIDATEKALIDGLKKEYKSIAAVDKFIMAKKEECLNLLKSNLK